MFRKNALILLPLLVLLTLLGTGHLAAQTATLSDPPLIRLQAVTFDPLTGEPDIPAGQRLTIQADRPTTYLIQFTGPVRNEWKAAVEKAGVGLYGYIPDYAFVARMDPATAESVRPLSFVRWVGLYHPAYRLSPDLSGTAISDSGSISVTVQTLPDADLDALAGQVEGWGGEVQGQAANAIAGYLRASLSTDRLTGLAALDGVLWVEPYFEPYLLNDVGGGQIMRADEIRSGLGLRGSGQIVAVADSGLDTGDLNTLHPDVQGRVIQTDCLGRPYSCDWSDYDGHGTHVAGSVLGDGSVSGGTYAGTAPQAQLVFQSVGDVLGGLTGIPEDDGDLMRTAYDDGARIHTNSWGAPTGGEENPYGGYDTASHQVDLAMWEHKDLLVLFAAGNEATDADSNGVADPDSVGSPGTAKNVLTVGASENDRDSITSTWGEGPSQQGDPWAEPIASDKEADNPDGMAAFSSRGPTDDGRVKPDIVAPGTFIASMRTRQPVFDDDMEGDTSGYLQASLQGGTVAWQLLTDDPHSSSHYWKQTVNGTYNAGATTALFAPTINVMPAGLFDIDFWHKYTLGGNDQLRIVLLAPDINNPSQVKHLTYILNVSGAQGTYALFRLVESADRLIQQGLNPTVLRIGFEIFSPDATYNNSTWWLDDVRVRAHASEAMSQWGLAQPGDAVDEAYVMMGGTSMATPLTAGAAALVREWLTTIRHIADPSAALMKAVLINGAADMRPGQYGSDSSQEIPALRPNNVTGWGRVDLVESLDPPDPRSIWLEEHPDGLSTGDSVGYKLTVGASRTLSLQERDAVKRGDEASGVTSPQGTDQLLQNGNFDTGTWTPWQTIGSPELTDEVYLSAPWSARLAGRNDADSDYVYQEVTVPSDATEVTVDFWYRVSSDDASSPEDYMCAEILDSEFTTVLVGVDCFELYYVEPKEQWLNFQRVISGTELAPLLGQTVLMSFQGWTNATNPSTVWVDDVSFKVTAVGPLRITLAWTDYPGEPAASPALANDLDLEVIASDGTHHYGNQGLYTGDPCLRDGKWDKCNNVEGVIIPGAPDSTYTVIVHGHNVPQGGSQPFALVASGDDLREELEEQNIVYLPVVVRNYDPSELLQNGNFDTGTWAPWQTIGLPELDNQVYHSAPWSARLGGRNDAVDYVYQEVTVPSNATEVTLDYWDRVSGDDPDPDEVMCFEIIDSGFGSVLAGRCLPLYTLSQNQWYHAQLVLSGTDLTPLLGQTVFVAFEVATNATNPSTAWVDDVSFKVTGVGP